jgi:hypothetical protein
LNDFQGKPIGIKLFFTEKRQIFNVVKRLFTKQLVKIEFVKFFEKGIMGYFG